MRDQECVQLLQWALPQLHMRWSGFRKIRSQVCKRIQRRIAQLNLDGGADYRSYLEAHSDEWSRLDVLARVTISRFYRDKMVFAFLEQAVLPELGRQALAQGSSSLDIWSVGCGSGEEPYTLAILWQLQLQHQFTELDLHIVATDVDPNMCRRAEQACYQYGSIKNLPAAWREQAFVKDGDDYYLRPEYRGNCTFTVQDVRQAMPSNMFDLVLCRNLVFTYYDEELQQQTLERMQRLLKTGGALLIGVHENLPEATTGFESWSDKFRIYRKL